MLTSEKKGILYFRTQNETIVRGVEMEMDEIIQSNPPAKAWSLEQVTEEHNQMFWNVSREGDTMTSLGSLFQFLDTLSAKNFFLMLV